jgi:hypothetical protein
VYSAVFKDLLLKLKVTTEIKNRSENPRKNGKTRENDMSKRSLETSETQKW